MCILIRSRDTPRVVVCVEIPLGELQKTAIAQNGFNALPRLKVRIVNVIAIFFKLGEWISVSFTYSYPMDALQKGYDGFEYVLGQKQRNAQKQQRSGGERNDERRC